MTPSPSPSTIAAGLSRDMRELALMILVTSAFRAIDVPWSRPGPTGNALNGLARRGLLTRFTINGERRSRYSITPLGLAVRAALQEPAK